MRYYDNVKKREKKAFNCSWSYALLLVIFIAMQHDVAISDEARAVGRKRLPVLVEHKRLQMTENLAGYRPGEPLPSRSKGLHETMLESADKRAEDKASGTGEQKPGGFNLINVFPPPIHGSRY